MFTTLYLCVYFSILPYALIYIYIYFIAYCIAQTYQWIWTLVVFYILWKQLTGRVGFAQKLIANNVKDRQKGRDSLSSDGISHHEKSEKDLVGKPTKRTTRKALFQFVKKWICRTPN